MNHILLTTFIFLALVYAFVMDYQNKKEQEQYLKENCKITSVSKYAVFITEEWTCETDIKP